MEIYDVGGSVRDGALGLEIKDRDYLVVGSSPSEMESLGYKKVGKSFDVYLSESGDEYALARKERKSGKGYGGFETEVENVTIEEDLGRRDLTINSMAMDSKGAVIDPYGGMKDIENRVLRNTTNAFEEDPLRILRLARFKARYHDLGFVIADDTVLLVKKMIERGDLNELTSERVLKEIEKSFEDENPHIFFSTLRDLGALHYILPEINNLFDTKDNDDHYGNAGQHTIMALKKARDITDDKSVLWSVLLHDLGKAITPIDLLPKHYGHEKHGLELVRNVCNRLRVDNKTKKLCLSVCEHHLSMHRIMELKPSTILRIIDSVSGFKDSDQVERFSLACMSDSLGRIGFNDDKYHQKDILLICLKSAQKINGNDIKNRGFTGPKIGEMLKLERIMSIKQSLGRAKLLFSESGKKNDNIDFSL